MGEERRYDEEEIAEILERATASEAGSAPVRAGSGRGLTIAQLQEIGSEVGIPPERIADAARTVARRDTSTAPLMFLGTPRSVSRVVSIPRPLDDDEWTRLVVDLRETFRAEGRVKEAGKLRTWSNGNLKVHVEPHGDGHRVRMETTKGNVVGLTALSGILMFMAIFLLLVAVPEGLTSAGPAAAIFAALSAGLFGYTRGTLPGWAEERAAQMEGLAERIPLLLE